MGWLTAAFISLQPASPAAAAEVGIDTDTTAGVSAQVAAQNTSLSKAAGVRWAREAVGWNLAQPTRGVEPSVAWKAAMDAVVRNDVAAGITPIMLIAHPPYWASADPDKYVDEGGSQHYNREYRPSDNADFAAFVGWVVKRYSPMGVRAFEILNEPNLPEFWPSGPDPAAYSQLLKAAAAAAHKASPKALVVSGGLAPNAPDGSTFYDFLRGMYAAGGAQAADQIGIHEYPLRDPEACWSDDGVHNSYRALCSLETLRQVMVENGDVQKKMWITELGWGTCTNPALPDWQNCVSEQQQASNLTGAYTKLQRDYPWVSVANWWSLRNLTPTRDDWVSSFGLVNWDFTPKPAYDALRGYSAGQAATTTGASSKRGR